MSKTIYDYKVKDIKGQTFDLKTLEGKVLLIVNTASQCGFTPQYKGLEELYKKYKDKGFMVLGFPCNQFGKQEPGDEKEISGFCEKNFGVTFPLFAKVDVNCGEADPLYQFLKNANPGILGTEAIKWNFTKFLVNKDGVPIKRFAPNDSPESLDKPIKELLG